MSKQYGLILPKKNQLSAPKAGNVFGNDDDSEEEEGTDWVKKALKAENEKNKVKKQVKMKMQKALKEDPTIFQYDEVYDEMERTKEEEKSVKKSVEKKPKYILNLLKTADLRKKEQELRKDRIIQKEIEEEESMYPDKERFVTSSYKAKLEEMKKFEEEQQNMDRLESIGDVTKQNDMTGFYRHLYRQTVERNEADLGIAPKVEKSEEKKDELPADIDKDDPILSDSESEASDKSEDESKTKASQSMTKKAKKRQYRKRAEESSESEAEPESKPESKLEKKKDEDGTKQIDTKETSETPAKIQKLSDQKSMEGNSEKVPVEKDVTCEKKEDLAESKDKTEVEEKPKVEPKPKINIWLKRTVGPVFEAALERYLIRKQQRLAGS